MIDTVTIPADALPAQATLMTGESGLMAIRLRGVREDGAPWFQTIQVVREASDQTPDNN